MSAIHVLFGTESGNAEMVADDVAEALSELGHHTQVREFTDVEVSDLVGCELAIVITSTYGEGGLAASTAPFHDALASDRPDLYGFRFAAFGLGDSSYTNYNNAIDTLSTLLRDLRAEQIGATGRHDATTGSSPSDEALSWVATLTHHLIPVL